MSDEGMRVPEWVKEETRALCAAQWNSAGAKERVLTVAEWYAEKVVNGRALLRGHWDQPRNVTVLWIARLDGEYYVCSEHGSMRGVAASQPIAVTLREARQQHGLFLTRGSDV